MSHRSDSSSISFNIDDLWTRANTQDPKLLLISLHKADTIEIDWNHFENQIHNANVYTWCKTGPCIPRSSHRPSKPLASVNLPNFPRNLKVQPRLTTESNGKRGTSNGRTKGLSKQDTKDIHKINGEKVAWVESHAGVALCHTSARALSWKLRILF